MFTLNVRVDTRAAVDRLNRIAKGMGDRALVRALNDTIGQVRTQMIKGITSEYAINTATVRDRLRIQRASRRGVGFTATLVGNPAGRAKRAMNLIRFLERKVTLAQARRRRKSGTLNVLRFKIKRRGSAKPIPGAFILNVPGTPVMQRVGPNRKDIEPLTTIGVPQMFQTKRVQIPVQQWIKANFPRIFDRHVRRFLSETK